MISDQGVQPGQPRHPFGQTPPHEPVPGGIHNLNIVMILCPVVTDEQHRDPAPSYSDQQCSEI